MLLRRLPRSRLRRPSATTADLHPTGFATRRDATAIHITAPIDVASDFDFIVILISLAALAARGASGCFDLCVHAARLVLNSGQPPGYDAASACCRTCEGCTPAAALRRCGARRRAL